MNQVSHCKGSTLNKGVDQVQWCCNEHEHVFNWFCNTCQEGCKSSRNKHSFVFFFFIWVHIAVDSHHDSHQDTERSDHLTNFETSWYVCFKQVLILTRICFLQVDKVCYPSQPKWILSKYSCSFGSTCKNLVATTQLSIVDWNGQHVVKTKRQEKTFQGTKQEWCQYWSC